MTIHNILLRLAFRKFTHLRRELINLKTADANILVAILNDIYGKIAAQEAAITALPGATPGPTIDDVNDLINAAIAASEAAEPALDATQVPGFVPATPVTPA